MENQRAHINAVRAHLAEIGLVASAGIDGMRSLLAIVREADEGGELPAPMRQALQALTARSTAGPDRPELERSIHAQHSASEASQRLEKIPGMGVIGATAIAATVTDPRAFKSGRDLAAWIGLVPRQNSTRQAEARQYLEAGRQVSAAIADRRRDRRHPAYASASRETLVAHEAAREDAGEEGCRRAR